MISGEATFPTLDLIEHNLQQVLQRIQRAADRAGRDASALQLVAVTKGFPEEVIRLAAQAGLRRIGENRAEEAVSKRRALQDLSGVEWHMIGHLQSRKAGLVPGVLEVVHSVDRSKIARLLDRHAGQSGVRLRALLQCNMSGEPAKSGWPLADPGEWAQVVPEFREISQLPHLEVLGLMTMAPLGAEAEIVRGTFGKLRRLSEFLRDRTGGSWAELSMGMTDDFELAVQEGASMLRIGRAIFGPRPGDV